MAWDAYLTLEGVSGESQRTGHEGQIEIDSFSFGASNQSSVGVGRGGGTGTVNMHGFTVTKRTDASSAEMFQHCCYGQHFPKATMVLYKSGGDAGALDYLAFDFEELYVDSINWTGSQGTDDVCYETVTFSFGRVGVTYSEQNPDGSRGGDHVGSWDVRTGQP